MSNRGLTAVNGRRAWLAVAIAVPIVVVAFHWQAARPGMAFAGSDLRYFFHAVREEVARSLLRGDLPLWQRGIFLGYPLVADPQAAVFDLATWLTLPWDAPRALTLATLLHLSIAGWGMAFWMRQRGLGAPEGLLAAVLFALGAKETAHVLHWNFAASTAWWPWMLAGLDGFVRRGRGRLLLLTAVATAGTWFGGSPQMAYFGTMLAFLHAATVVPGLWRRRPADALLALAAPAAGILLAAPLVLATAELARFGPRGSGIDYRFATSWKWSDRFGLALLLFPRALGGPFFWTGEMNAWEATGYLGILPLALAAAAPLRRAGLLAFAAVAVIGIWVSFGEDASLGLHHALFRWLPGYAGFRNPTRALMLTSFLSALLAAEGLFMLRSVERSWRRAAASAAVLVAVAVAALLIPRLPGFSLDRAAALAGARTLVALVAAGIAWLAVVVRSKRTWRPALALAASGLCAADLYLAVGDFNEVARSVDERPLLSAVAPLVPQAPAPRRVGVVAKWGRTANATLRQGWEGVTGYGPMCIQRVRSLIEATGPDRVAPPGPVTHDTNFPRPRPASPLWALFATDLVVSDARQPLPAVGRAGREWENPLVAYRAAALPRVFWTGSYEVADDASVSEPLRRATSGRTAVLAEPPAGLPPGAPARIAAEEVRVFPRTLEATLVAPRAGLAVILDPFYPGWTATVDGAAAPILRADYAFQAVPVPGGRHRLRLEYRNRWVGIGFAVAAGTLAIAVALLGWRKRTAAPLP